METNMIMEAIRFMALGMSIVTFFLVIMIQSIKLQAFLIGKFFPETTPNQAPRDIQRDDDEQARVAAVIAAVTDFRKNKS